MTTFLIANVYCEITLASLVNCTIVKEQLLVGFFNSWSYVCLYVCMYVCM